MSYAAIKRHSRLIFTLVVVLALLVDSYLFWQLQPSFDSARNRWAATSLLWIYTSQDIGSYVAPRGIVLFLLPLLSFFYAASSNVDIRSARFRLRASQLLLVSELFCMLYAIFINDYQLGEGIPIFFQLNLYFIASQLLIFLLFTYLQIRPRSIAEVVVAILLILGGIYLSFISIVFTGSNI